MGLNRFNGFPTVLKPLNGFCYHALDNTGLKPGVNEWVSAPGAQSPGKLGEGV